MRKLHSLIAGSVLALSISASISASASAPVADEEESGGNHIGTGTASYYGNEFAGRRTANGEKFSPNGMTAAHRTLAFNTKVRVTHLGNGKSVVVRINDRGPWGRGRIIDLSYGAAKEIGMHRSGTARVRLESLD